MGVKLPRIDIDNARRSAVARKYDEMLADLPLTLPAVRPNTHHVYHLYVVACDNRGGLKSHLAEREIGTAVHYPVPVHQQKGYADRVRLPENGLPVTERIVDRILTLPVFPELGDDDIARVVAAVRGFYKASL